MVRLPTHLVSSAYQTPIDDVISAHFPHYKIFPVVHFLICVQKNLLYPDLLTFDLCCGINWKFDVKGRIKMISNPYIISALLYIYSCTLLLEVYTGLIYKSIRLKYYIMFNVILCVHNSS